MPPPSEAHHNAADARSALRYLRSHTLGALHFDALILKRAIALDPITSDPVITAPPAVLTADHVVLHLPEESDDALQLLVEPVELNPDTDPACDRWRIYHGTPRDPRFIRLEIQSARLRSAVFDADDLRLANPLANVEPRLCSLLNADLAALSAWCIRETNVTPTDPRAVGIDPDGLDIRARFGIIRINFDPPVDAATAEPRLRQLLLPAQS